ncbi:hypothetical protein FVB32_05270 [Flagellimonas hymeniacidonis]|uniref:Bacteriophage abortive infection AbiH n=1 Tax=Flagellimonas hymeniacidonis TaxID=2603628 RepID=A0A5C8V950_9FLAO|nr:AbiH family protein [Flagellimonas hymeniacidonis]TXN37699.1 hypothetical protein FVB32_05270 [Flagellimonas hymeniacidonis]
MTSKNLIIIIGNGFDLAHGLKTSFSDFADYLIENLIVPELDKVVVRRQSINSLFQPEFTKELSRKSMTSYETNHLEIIWSTLMDYRPNELIQYLKKEPQVIAEFINNKFLGKLYANRYINWFDIENAYFQELVITKNRILGGGSTKKNIEGLEVLNREFTEVKDLLSKYLKTIEITKSQEIQDFFDSYLRRAANAYIINFNFTNTIEDYFKRDDYPLNIETNYIHGSLMENNIVFGYGNDKDSDYEDIKNLEIDEFLMYFKTFEYQRNSNYNQIHDHAIKLFTKFEILVLGHSLGTTDKTLLAELFNSTGCNKVHIFKRRDLENNPNNAFKGFIKLTYSASRIFANEETLRKKLSNYEQSAFFP